MANKDKDAAEKSRLDLLRISPGATPPLDLLPDLPPAAPVDDEQHWERPFGDTGRGSVPIPAIISKTHPYAEGAHSYWSYLTSPRTRHLIAGGLAGAGARLLTHPFDRTRTAMLLFPYDPRFASMSSTFRTFVTELGWRVGLFRGLDISLVKIVPEVALKFAVYEEIKKNLIAVHVAQTGNHSSFLDRFWAGGIAGFISHLCIYPFKVVQTRLANQRPFGSEFAGISDAFGKLYQQTGVTGFYRGFFVSVTAMVPAMGLDFAMYGLLKKLYKAHYHTQGQLPPVYILLACGTLASTVAHVATYPLILPRTRMQAGDYEALQIQTPQKNMWGYLWDVYRRDGVVRGLYCGLAPSLAKVVPAVSLSFVFYEKISQMITPPRTALPLRAGL